MTRPIIPSGVAIILAAVGGVLQGLNAAFPGVITGVWHALIVYVLLVLTSIGISPLVGAAFRNWLHLPLAVVSALTVLLFALTAAVQTFSLSAGAKGIILGVITLLGGLGYGAAGGPVPGRPLPPAVH